MLWWRYSRNKYEGEWEKCATQDCKYLFPQFSDNLRCTPNIIFQQRPEFKNYKNKTILIIGGGGSTNNLDWESLNTYDYIWSVNHFFLHPILKDVAVDLVMMMGEPDINRKEWIDYRNKFKPLVGFEISEKWEGSVFDDYENYFCMHTFVYDLLGACVRMIEFACELQVAAIDFVGLDGVEAIEKGEHAFQPGKTTLPSMLANYTGRNIRAASMTSSTIFKAKYNIFWERMKKNHPHTSFHNLGGGEKYHKAIMHSHSG